MAKAIWWLDMISAVSQLITGLYLWTLFSDIFSPVAQWLFIPTIIVAVSLQIGTLTRNRSVRLLVPRTVAVLNPTNLRLTLSAVALFCWSLLGKKFA